MAKMRENMPPEAEEARLLFIEVGRLRREGKAEALRALEARIADQSNHLKSLVARMLASGIEIHEVIKSTGMSRQTITNYKNDYLKLTGLEDVSEISARIALPEDKVADDILPDGVTTETSMVQIDRDGNMAPVHDFWDSRGLIGTLDLHQPDGKHWYDNLGTGMRVEDVPEYAMLYAEKWARENA